MRGADEPAPSPAAAASAAVLALEAAVQAGMDLDEAALANRMLIATCAGLGGDLQGRRQIADYLEFLAATLRRPADARLANDNDGAASAGPGAV